MEDDPSLADLVFPRLESEKKAPLRDHNVPPWHWALVERIRGSDDWKTIAEAYDSAWQEESMYANILSLLSLIKSKASKCAESVAAMATSNISFFDTHLNSLVRSGRGEGPDIKPDISGMFGVHPKHASQLLTFRHDANGCVSTFAHRLLVPIEVELVRPSSQKKPVVLPDEDEDLFILNELNPDGGFTPQQPRSGRAALTSDSSRQPGPSRDRRSTVSRSLDPRTQAMGDTKARSSPRSQSRSLPSSSTLPQTPPMMLSPRIPDLFGPVSNESRASHKPHEKMVQLVNYLSAA